MTFDLHVDVESWREHLAAVLAEHPGLVPVAKGNGYGFGIDLLGAETGRLGLGALAVGTRYEVARPARRTPATSSCSRPGTTASTRCPSRTTRRSARCRRSRRCTHSRHPGRRRASSSRSRRRCTGTACRTTGSSRWPRSSTGLTLEGFALHLPLAEPKLGRLAETEALIARLWGAALPVERLWVSHLSPSELRSGAGASTRRSTCDRASARRCGSVGGTPCAPRARCSTSTSSSAARATAIGSARCRAGIGSSW